MESKPKIFVSLKINYQGSIFPRWTISHDGAEFLNSRDTFLSETAAEIHCKNTIYMLNTHLLKTLEYKELTQENAPYSFLVVYNNGWGYYTDIILCDSNVHEACTLFFDSHKELIELINLIQSSQLVLNGISYDR